MIRSPTGRPGSGVRGRLFNEYVEITAPTHVDASTVIPKLHNIRAWNCVKPRPLSKNLFVRVIECSLDIVLRQGNIHTIAVGKPKLPHLHMTDKGDGKFAL